MSKPRGRALGLPFTGTTGEFNAITDVPGVGVGFSSIVEDPATGSQVRTGVTAIVPRLGERRPVPVWAGYHALNGNGEMTGTHWVEDGGYIVGPVCLTNTHSVGIVHHAAVRWTIDTYTDDWKHHHLWAMPVVAETYDGVLSDINGLHVTEAHARAALDAAATGPVAEGNVGGGTGMIAFEFKGGTGTASRRLNLGDERYHLGVLVQANYGRRDWLTMLGVPVGQHLRDDLILPEREQGSIIVVIITDLPLLPHQLRGVAKRGAIGIGRLGSPGGQSSGDIFLALSTANPVTPLHTAKDLLSLQAINPAQLDPVYEAAVDATEEAVINAMLAAEDTPTAKPTGKTCRAIDHMALTDLMRRYNRMPA